MIDFGDSTLPDLVLGQTEPLWGAVVLQNATTNAIEASLLCPGRKSAATKVSVPPLGIRKAPFAFVPPKLEATTNHPITLEVDYHGNGLSGSAHTTLSLRVRRSEQTFKQTFISTIDDSVQYYAVNPPPPLGPSNQHARGAFASANTPPALFLSLHGAGVEAIGQADAYSPKRWGVLACPTNRRPYGFDWEDWGRLDALEVLALAQAQFHPDPSRIYLTGHSMGGHGTWQLGALFPDRFAAIGPSAGWISFMSYAATNRLPATNSLQRLLRRALAPSDTLLMGTNYLQEGVYILHGDADDNVPVGEAREMRRVLGQFHHDLDFHEQPGAGHWWDASDEPGADCVDWAPMFDFFAHHRIPRDEELREIRFVTVNPAISSHCHWVTIAAQEYALEPSAVDVRCDPAKRRLVGTTTNVAQLWLGLPALAPGAALAVELDSQKLQDIPWPASAEKSAKTPSAPFPAGIWLVRTADQWHLGTGPTPSEKNPERSGPFRQAFRNHMLFVYGTQGTPQENGWAFNKARYDAEVFWYRGNGSVELTSDEAYLRRQNLSSPGSSAAKSERVRKGAAARNIILYGNADGNLAWPVLLKDSPVLVRRGVVRIGDHRLEGDDLACLFLRPMPGDNLGLVGVVSGSGLPGMRLSERLPYFMSGVGFPDCFVVGAEMLQQGIGGVRVAGFFGQDWSVEKGEFGWRD
jgi:dienelactone hydrolase